MARSVDDILKLHGGIFDPAILPASLSTDHFRNIETVLKVFATGMFPGDSEPSNPDFRKQKYKWDIAFATNPSVEVWLHPLDEDDRYLVVIPIGLYARMYILACRLITYWPLEEPKAFEASILDSNYEGVWQIPQLVKPIFDFYKDDELNLFWQDVDRFQCASSFNDRMWYDVTRVINASLLFALLHEWAHLIWQHRNPINDLIAPLTKEMDPVRRLVRKGFELQADIDAATPGVASAKGGIEADGYKDDNQKVGTDFVRIGYAYTMIFGAFDPWQRSFEAYQRRDHPHPIIRHYSVLESTWLTLKKDEPEHWAELWAFNAKYGFKKCIEALNWLSHDCMSVPSDSRSGAPLMIPVHALCHPSQVMQDATIRRQINAGRLIKTATDALVLKYEAGKLKQSDLMALLPISELIESNVPLDHYVPTLEKYLEPIFGEFFHKSIRNVGMPAGESPFF
jgi:hypothetical protein